MQVFRKIATAVESGLVCVWDPSTVLNGVRLIRVSESPFNFLSVMGNHHSKSVLALCWVRSHSAKYTESWPLGFWVYLSEPF